MFRKYRGVILMLISVLFLSLAFDCRSLVEGLDGDASVSVVYNANKLLHDTIIADTKALRRSLNDYKKSIIKTLPRQSRRPRQLTPQIKAIDDIIASLQNLYTRYNIANILSIDQYKSLFLDIKTSMTQIITNNFINDFTTRAQGINIKIDNLVKIIDKQILYNKTLKAIKDISAAPEKSTCPIDLANDVQYFIKECYAYATGLSTWFVIMKPDEVEHVFYMYNGKITENCQNNDCRLGDTLLIKYSAAFLPLFVMCPGSIAIDNETTISYNFSLTQADVDNKTAVYTKYVGDLDNLVKLISSIDAAIEGSKTRLLLNDLSNNYYNEYLGFTYTLKGKIEDLKLKLSGKLIAPIQVSSA
jgi:hypothetical protein